MTTLRASPFNLAYGDLVVARITAINDIGSSSASAENTSGGTIQTEPTQMATPTKGDNTNANQI